MFFIKGFSFKFVLFKNLYFFKIKFLKNKFLCRIWRVVKFLIRNLTRCKILTSKSCFLYLLFRFLLHCYQSAREQLVGLWLGVKRFFTSVWHVFVSQLVQSFWLLRFLWHLGSWWVCWLYHLHYQLNYKNLFGIQKIIRLQRFYFKRCYNTIKVTMTIKKTIYNFYYFEFKFSLFNFFNSFCKHWTTALRCFCLLKRAEQRFLVLFRRESLFCNARHSVHSLVSVIKGNYSLHDMKHLSFLCNNFPTESILE